MKGRLEFKGGCIPGAKTLEDATADKTSGVINPDDNSPSWFVDVLEDGTAITYEPWFQYPHI